MRDPRVDAYITEKAPEYARPILAKLRRLVHRADPKVTETIKWGVPHFEHDGIVLGMAAFKKHVSFGFWNARAMKDPEGLFGGHAKASPFAIKVSTAGDLPPDDVLVAYMKEAVAVNVRGHPKRGTPRSRPEAVVPEDLAAGLARSREARLTFAKLSPSQRREYVEWLTEARRDATRTKRLATALEWLAEGKPRNWKYLKTR